ncbi:MAG: hypothetical protein AB7N91_33020 [Candidatus Tectimicrobiota bacterium]
MKDKNDSETLDLLDKKTVNRAGRGRPAKRPTLGAMTTAQRKREQRARQAEAIQNSDGHEWTDAECLAVLNGAQWRGGAIDKAAWEQLGRLRGFVTATKRKG